MDHQNIELNNVQTVDAKPSAVDTMPHNFLSQPTRNFSEPVKKSTGKIAALVAAATIAGLGIISFANSFTTIESGEVGVVRRFGDIQSQVLTEGVNFTLPFVDTVRRESIRVRIAEFDTSSASRDLVEIQTAFAINFQVDPGRVAQLHREVGGDFVTVILDPAIQETMKFTTANFTAEELVTRRSEVSAAAAEYLQERVEPFGINILAINITDLAFSSEFSASIEQRQIAEQRVLTAQQELEHTRVQAEQEVVRAQAEADAMRILQQELTPELLQRLWIERWNGVMPLYMGGDATVMLPAPTAPAAPASTD
ncbi:MAG: prohibitin family protein [Promicromonosporaceae bacterium]|nr:prohibitin family protein [Promicromonosporaceae bacterium]